MNRAALSLLAILFLGGSARWAVMEAAPPSTLVGDERYYVGVAASLAHAGRAQFEDTRALRPPAHAFLLSLLWPNDADGAPAAAPNLHRFMLCEVVLGTAVVGLTMLLGAALFDRPTGLVAALGVAIFPNLVVFSHYLWSENLYSVLLLSALLIVVRARRAPGVAAALAAGATFGLGALTRETSLLTAAMAALWWMATASSSERRRAVVMGALMCAVAGLCILPWIVRNSLVLGRLVPVSTIGWYAAAEGNSLESPDWMTAWGPRRDAFRTVYTQTDGELARMDLARRYSLEQIAAEQPTWIFKKAVRSTTQLFTPNSPLLYRIAMGGYEPIPAATLESLARLTTLPCILVFLLGTLGMAAARGEGRLAFPCLIIGGSLFVHVLTAAAVRYRMPMIPLFVVYAAHLVTTRAAPLRSMTARRWLGVAAVWAFYLGVCVPYSADVAIALGGQPANILRQRQQ